jgi:hypothetical protein
MLGMVACIYHPSYEGKHKIGRSVSRLTQAKNKSLFQKQPGQKGLEEWLKRQSACPASTKH